MKTINLEIQVPDWVEWIAMDDSGAWIGFSDEPAQDVGWWRLEEGSEANLTIGGPWKYPDWGLSLRKV